jgi:hypothetical protein
MPGSFFSDSREGCSYNLWVPAGCPVHGCGAAVAPVYMKRNLESTDCRVSKDVISSGMVLAICRHFSVHFGFQEDFWGPRAPLSQRGCTFLVVPIALIRSHRGRHGIQRAEGPRVAFRADAAVARPRPRRNPDRARMVGVGCDRSTGVKLKMSADTI